MKNNSLFFTNHPMQEHRSGRMRMLFQNFLISLAILFLLTVTNRILFPCYRQIFARDVTIEVNATGQKCEESLYNNVRLSRVICNGNPCDLSMIPLDGNWEYSESDDFLYNYHTADPNGLVFEFQDLITVDFIFVSERGSGLVQLSADGIPFEQLDLYSDADWEYSTVRYDTSALVHPEQHPHIIFSALLVIMLLVWLCSLRLSAEQMAKAVHSSICMLLLGLLALFLMLACLFIQYQQPSAMEEYRSADYFVHMETFILVFLPLMLLYFLTRSHWISFGITAFVLELLHLISGFKQTARGTPLLPWDFQIAGAALSVAEGYDLSLSGMSITVLLCTGLILLALFICRSSFQKPRLPASLLSGGICAAMLILFMQTSVYSCIWGSIDNSRVYQVSNYYNNNSFLVSFAEYTSYLKPQQAPENYSEEAMQQLASQMTEQYGSAEIPDTASSDLPNIIVIMSESFWDVTTLENVTFESDPIPVFRQLSEESMHGELLSHVFGGNTVVSEFEFLTGFHASFFPAGYMVYGSSLGDQFASAASILDAQGYHTVAMHPYKATNYNRNTSYPTLGFAEAIFEDDFPENAQRIRGYISDQAMFQELIDRYESHQERSDAPLFLFGITMQNHGGYWPETLHAPTKVNFTAEGYQDSTISCMEDYFAGLSASDAALGELVDYFSNTDEETIIIYFGDHQSDAGTKAEKMFGVQSWYDDATFANDVRAHTVPYLVWSNCGITAGEQPIMDISALLPTVLSQTNVRMPPVWKYLLDQRQLIPAFNDNIAIGADQIIHRKADLGEEAQEFLKTYQLLTYDYVWGKRYAGALWELS